MTYSKALQSEWSRRRTGDEEERRSRSLWEEFRGAERQASGLRVSRSGARPPTNFRRQHHNCHGDGAGEGTVQSQ